MDGACCKVGEQLLLLQVSINKLDSSCRTELLLVH